MSTFVEGVSCVSTTICRLSTNYVYTSYCIVLALVHYPKVKQCSSYGMTCMYCWLTVSLEWNHSWESDGRDSNYQVRRLINLGLIKDLILSILSVDLWNGKGAGKKGGAAGDQTEGLWLFVPVLCRWATTPTSNHPSFLPYVARSSILIFSDGSPQWFVAMHHNQRMLLRGGELLHYTSRWHG